MSDIKSLPPVADAPKKTMDAAAAAKAVRRPVRSVKKDDAGNEVEKISFVAVKAGEVLAFRDYGTHVVVVTLDGQKFSSADTVASREPAEA